MNITPLKNFRLSDSLLKNNNRITPSLRLKPQLSQDTLSFGCRTYDPNVPSDIQLYRSVGPEELLALLNGKTVRGSSHYATSDPRGWSSRDWNSGYVYDKSSPVFFVTFKTDTDFDVDDRRDSSRDTRYGICNYSLKDIRNVRTGSNAHGEIVYSENLEADKIEDKKIKSEEIARCKKIVSSESASIEQKMDAWDILASYAQEFPNVIDFECDFEDETFVNGLSLYLHKANNPEYADLARKCVKTQIDHPYMGIRLETVGLLEKFGDERDVQDIITLTKMGKADSYIVAGVLNRMIKDDKCDEYLIQELKNPNPDELLTLVTFFAHRNKDFKYNDLYRDILTNVVTKEMYLTAHGINSYKLYDIINTISQQLADEGDLRSVACLENFYREERPYDYPSAEVKAAIDTILEKNNGSCES